MIRRLRPGGFGVVVWRLDPTAARRYNKMRTSTRGLVASDWWLGTSLFTNPLQIRRAAFSDLNDQKLRELVGVELAHERRDRRHAIARGLDHHLQLTGRFDPLPPIDRRHWAVEVHTRGNTVVRIRTTSVINHQSTVSSRQSAVGSHDRRLRAR